MKLHPSILFYAFVASSTPLLANNRPNTPATTEPDVSLLPGIPTLDTRPFTLSSTDHVVEEFVATGTATSYEPAGELTSDGRWKVEAADTAPYVTRFVVVRPTEVGKFNGTIVVEWLNVTGGFDYSPARIMMKRELERSGYIWVGVSAQIVGVEGGPSLAGLSMPLKKLNAERYAKLSHPGDAYSFDIYSQVGRILKGPQASRVLGGFTPRHVISMGESQSAMYLTTYINAIDPIARVYDGFLNYSRFGFAAPLEGAPINSGWLSSANPIGTRPDLRVPVLIFVTETDVIGCKGPIGTLNGYHAARTPATDMLRVWEIAGTAHADSYLNKVSKVDTDSASLEVLAEAWAPTDTMQGMTLDKAFNNAPQQHYCVQAAIAALTKWVATGVAPSNGEPIELVPAANIGEPVQTVVDDNGNSMGGVRSPWVDVPTSRLSGASMSNHPMATLVGWTEPFDLQTLDRLYPGGKAEYLKKFEAALDTQIAAGFILQADKDEIMGIAALSYQGSP